MSLAWEPVTVDGFTVRPMVEEELWSQVLGDATAETTLEETLWEGAGAGPGLARQRLEHWQALRAWFLGLYRGGDLIGLYDIGHLATWTAATGEKQDGAGDIMAEPGTPDRWVQVTLWMATRPAARGQVPATVFRTLSVWFLRRLWDGGIRQLVMYRTLTVQEGRAHAQQVEAYGWRTLARRGLTEIKIKRLEHRP